VDFKSTLPSPCEGGEFLCLFFSLSQKGVARGIFSPVVALLSGEVVRKN